MHLLTVIKIFHLLGLILGLGGAVFLDFSILTRGILRPVSNYTIHNAEKLSRIVTVGLAILWVTGIALIIMNVADKPEYLTNPKLWAKIVIVVALTVNGVYIHRSVLPFMKRRLGQRLFANLSKRYIALFTMVASISFVSWTMPFILGKASELNYVTPMWVILAVYAASLAVMWIGMFTVMAGLTELQNFAMNVVLRSVPESAKWESREFGRSAGQALNIPVGGYTPTVAVRSNYHHADMARNRSAKLKESSLSLVG